MFLLRNLPKKGIGFTEANNFYPDFICWIKKDTKQNIVFIDPHGLIHASDINDPKIEFNNKIGNLLNRKNIELYSFIISRTSYDDLDTTTSIDEFHKNNVFFKNEPDYISRIFNKVIN